MPSAAIPFPPQPSAPAPTATIDPVARRRLLPPAARDEPAAGAFRAELSRAARSRGARPEARSIVDNPSRPARAQDEAAAPAKSARSGKPKPRPSAARTPEGRTPDESAEDARGAGDPAGAGASRRKAHGAVSPTDDDTVVEPTASDGPEAGDEPADEDATHPVDPMTLPFAAAVPAPVESAGTVSLDADQAAAAEAATASGPSPAPGGTAPGVGLVPRPGSDPNATSAVGDALGNESGAATRDAGAAPIGSPVTRASAASRPAQPAGVAALGSGPADGFGTTDTSALGADPSTDGSRSGQDVPAAADASTAIEFAEAFAEATSLNPASAASEQVGGQPAAGSFGNGFGPPDPSVFGRTVSDGNAPTAAASGAQPAGGATPAEAITEDRFAAVNHTRIAREVRGELMPDGGSMHLRLDPPELGALQVSLHMRDGVVTAAFQAQNEDAARLLSHTMGDLRTSLEAHGIVVDKLHVQQAPRDEPARDNPGGGSRQNATPEQQQDARREQQRKDMVQRLWDKLAGNAPLDLVA